MMPKHDTNLSNFAIESFVANSTAWLTQLFAFKPVLMSFVSTAWIDKCTLINMKKSRYKLSFFYFWKEPGFNNC